MTLRAARKPNGKARMAAASVPRKAMANVSAERVQSIACSVAVVPYDGGNISETMRPSSPNPPNTRAHEKSSDDEADRPRAADQRRPTTEPRHRLAARQAA